MYKKIKHKSITFFELIVCYISDRGATKGNYVTINLIKDMMKGVVLHDYTQKNYVGKPT